MIRPGVSFARTEYGGVLLDERKGWYYQLNEVAADIVDALSNGKNIDDVVLWLSVNYVVSGERARTDVLDHIDGLAKLGLVNERGA